MRDITQPLAVIKLKLPLKYWVQVIVWNDLEELHQNTPSEKIKDYWALFQAEGNRSKCVGVINFSRTHLSNSIRAHELQHMISHMVYKLYDEKIATIAEEATSNLDKALSEVGLLNV